MNRKIKFFRIDDTRWINLQHISKIHTSNQNNKYQVYLTDIGATYTIVEFEQQEGMKTFLSQLVDYEG